MKVAILSVLLAGCASFQATKQVDIPVLVSCVKQKPVRPPFYTDAQMKAMNDYQLSIALWVNRIQASNYIGELEAVMSACEVKQ